MEEATREQQLAEQFKEGLDPAGAVAMAARVDELEGQVETLTADLAAARAATAKAETAATKAKASVTRSEKSTKPRKLGAVDAGLTGEDLDAALAEADADGDTIEIVVSDGKKEITGIAPIAVTGDVWRDHIRGKMLRDPVKIHGPQHGDAPYAIDGYALLIDGKQVAYCKRSDPINVAPGQEISLADDIFF